MTKFSANPGGVNLERDDCHRLGLLVFLHDAERAVAEARKEEREQIADAVWEVEHAPSRKIKPPTPREAFEAGYRAACNDMLSEWCVETLANCKLLFTGGEYALWLDVRAEKLKHAKSE